MPRQRPSSRGTPGTPAPATLQASDATLAALGPDRLFAAIFGTWPDVARKQPAAVVLACAPTGCDATLLRAAVARHPGRVFWVDGDLTLDSAGDIGSTDAPVVAIVDGSLRFTAAVTVHGLVYSRAATWDSAGHGTIRGAAVAQGHLRGHGAFDIVYDAAILRRLRLLTGSFVQVPGSWRDFE